MNTFTLIADCMGGTFVSQYVSSSLEDVLQLWLEDLPAPLSKMISENGETDGEALYRLAAAKDMLSLEPLYGMRSVWAGYLNLHGKDVFIHVVKTEFRG